MRLILYFVLAFPASLVAQDAKIVWRTYSELLRSSKSTFPVTSGPVFIDDDRLVCVFPPGRTLAIDDSTGKRIWLFPWMESHVTSEDDHGREPTVWGNRTTSLAAHSRRKLLMLVRGNSSAMVALDWKREGAFLWRTFGPYSEDDPTLKHFDSLGPPCVVADKAYCLAAFEDDLLLVSLDVTTGKSQRKHRLGSRSHVSSQVGFSPARCGSVLVCPTPMGDLTAVSITDGKQLWTHKLQRLLDKPFRLHATEAHVLLFSDGVCSCFDGTSGQVVWSRESLGQFPFVATKDTVFVSSDAGLEAIDIPMGRRKWSRALRKDQRLTANGAAQNGKLFVPIDPDVIHEYDTATGDHVASYTCPIPVGHLFARKQSIYSMSRSSIARLKLRDNE